ncbi:MAG: GTPase domain-containing protein [Labilithrix sp.]|nr:GTPase domain-containing protein [Labilithrix sp.]MCW5814805.1 GTPase domain-containing protein [Labilithrix sp.]
MSGKTTNLKALHELTRQDSRGRLMTLETKDDRTLFFDMLPLVFKADSKDGAMNLRVKVFTVPGQVVHASTRKLVLQGADAVAFIADSQISETENNAASFLDLRENLKALGRSMRDVPCIIQFNKRDLTGVRTDLEIDDLALRGKEPVYKASAVHGRGVIESFFGLLEGAWRKLDTVHDLTEKLHIEPDAFLAKAAESLGYPGRWRELSDAHVGGQLKAGRR